jgi:glycosyltransferase involved in cell wall biosynthesis
MKITVDHGRIRWHGRLDREGVGEVIAGGDVLVLPSIYHEVFGLVLLEAHSIGRPVVASRSGGPADIVRDGENGILLEPGNIEAWAQALRTLLHQPERIAAMASNVGPVRTIEDHVADLEAVYDRAIALRTAAGKPRLTP